MARSALRGRPVGPAAIVPLCVVLSVGCFRSHGRGAGPVDDPPPPSLAPPMLERVDPAGPANDNRPEVSGRVEAGLTVRLYADPDCADELARGPAPTGRFALPIDVPDDSVTDIYAAALRADGGRSACTARFLTYVEDSTPPPPPRLTATDPASPGDSDAPRVLGQAEAASTVQLYRDETCTEPWPGALADVSGEGEFAIAVSLPPEPLHRFWATATDAAGNRSACGGPLEYIFLGVPFSSLIFPPGPALTDQPALTVRGRVAAPEVVEVQVGGRVATRQDDRWRLEVALTEGEQTLPIRAVLADGRTFDAPPLRVTRRSGLPQRFPTVRDLTFDSRRNRVLALHATGLDRWDPATGRAEGLLTWPAAGLRRPRVVAYAPGTDQVLVVDDGALLGYDAETLAPETLGSANDGGVPALPRFATQLVVGDGKAYVLGRGFSGSLVVIEVDLADGARRLVADYPVSRRPRPSALAFDDGEGRLLYLDAESQGLRALSLDGVDEDVRTPLVDAGEVRPGTLVADSGRGEVGVVIDGAVAVVDQTSGAERYRSPGSAPGSLTDAVPLTRAPDGEVLYASAGRVLMVVDPGAGAERLLREEHFGDGPHLRAPLVLTRARPGDALYVVDDGAHRTVELDPATGDRRSVTGASDDWWFLDVERAALAVDAEGGRAFQVTSWAEVLEYDFDADGPSSLVFEVPGLIFRAAGTLWDPARERLVYRHGESLWELDPAGGRPELLATLAGSGDAVRGLARQADLIFVVDQNELRAVDADSGEVTVVGDNRGAEPPVRFSGGLDVSPDGETLWTLRQPLIVDDDGARLLPTTLVEVAVATGEQAVLATVGRGPAPDGLLDVQASADGEVLWTLSTSLSALVAVDARTRERVIANW